MGVAINHINRSFWNYYSGAQLTFGPRATAALAGVVVRNRRERVFIVTDETLGMGEQPFLRLEYRPNNRLYMVASYGRQNIGDGPFVVEDRDVGLSRANDALYRLMLRGDF